MNIGQIRSDIDKEEKLRDLAGLAADKLESNLNRGGINMRGRHNRPYHGYGGWQPHNEKYPGDNEYDP